MTPPQIGRGADAIRVVVVGGLDPGGGAGLLRDVATATALGAHPHAIGTAWTEQSAGVHRVEPRSATAVRAAMAHAVAVGAAAVKIGMAVGPATAAAIVDGLGAFAGPVVVDPVLATSRGGALWDGPPDGLLPLLRRATLVTPNAPEAARLAEGPVGHAAEAEAAGRRLIALGLRAVLIKGGHLDAEAAWASDHLITPAGSIVLRHPRAPGPSPRGTGCALATALAVELARGHDLAAAAEAATTWLAARIAAATDVGDQLHLRY